MIEAGERPMSPSGGLRGFTWCSARMRAAGALENQHELKCKDMATPLKNRLTLENGSREPFIKYGFHSRH
jgi:hypothetical protein